MTASAVDWAVDLREFRGGTVGTRVPVSTGVGVQARDQTPTFPAGWSMTITNNTGADIPAGWVLRLYVDHDKGSHSAGAGFLEASSLQTGKPTLANGASIVVDLAAALATKPLYNGSSTSSGSIFTIPTSGTANVATSFQYYAEIVVGSTVVHEQAFSVSVSGTIQNVAAANELASITASNPDVWNLGGSPPEGETLYEWDMTVLNETNDIETWRLVVDFVAEGQADIDETFTVPAKASRDLRVESDSDFNVKLYKLVIAIEGDETWELWLDEDATDSGPQDPETDVVTSADMSDWLANRPTAIVNGEIAYGVRSWSDVVTALQSHDLGRQLESQRNADGMQAMLGSLGEIADRLAGLTGGGFAKQIADAVGKGLGGNVGNIADGSLGVGDGGAAGAGANMVAGTGVASASGKWSGLVGAGRVAPSITIPFSAIHGDLDDVVVDFGDPDFDQYIVLIRPIILAFVALVFLIASIRVIGSIFE